MPRMGLRTWNYLTKKQPEQFSELASQYGSVAWAKESALAECLAMTPSSCRSCTAQTRATIEPLADSMQPGALGPELARHVPLHGRCPIAASTWTRGALPPPARGRLGESQRRTQPDPRTSGPPRRRNRCPTSSKPSAAKPPGRAVRTTPLCRPQQIVVQSWIPLGQGGILLQAPVGWLAMRHGKSPGQVVLRWHATRTWSRCPKHPQTD